MKISEINQIIDNVVSEEVRRTILKESKENKKEVYHIKCEGIPLATFESEAEAEENLPQYKAKHKGELIIEKSVYESQDDMLDKLDEMNDQLEETDDMKSGEMNEWFSNQSDSFEYYDEIMEEVKAKVDGWLDSGKIDDQEHYEMYFKIDSSDYEWNYNSGGDKVKHILIQLAKECAPHLLKKKKKETDNMENTEMNEKLVGNQHKLDKNHNGEIDAQDFKILKGQKNEEEECQECSASMEEELHGDQDKIDADHDGKISANDFRMLLKKKKEGDEQQGDVAEEFEKDGEDVYSIWEKYNGAALKEHDPTTFSDEFEYADNVISHIVQDAMANGDIDDEDEEELIDDLKDTYGYDLFDMFRDGGGDGFEDDDEDEDVDLSNEVNENKGMCNECGGMMNEEGMCNECGSNMYESTKKRTIRVTESELAQLIAKMVNESTPGLDAYKKAHKESGKQNKEGIDAMMKDVNKNHIDVEGNDKPEFPHQVGKGEKVARKNTKEQDEEVAKNFAGLQNLDYDNEPDEKFKKRLKMAIEGDKLMGNASTTEKTTVKPTNGSKLGEVSKDKDGNSTPTPETAKGLEVQMKNREEDKKKRVLYKKEAVPTNESKVSLNNVLMEELNKMKKLSSYNKKTQ
jgi:hypothetical protein